jgi:CBS domain-containing protein
VDRTKQQAEASRKLLIRSRTIEGGADRDSVELTVACPVQQRSVPVEECAVCDRCEEVAVEQGPGLAHVTCRVPVDPSAVLPAHRPTSWVKVGLPVLLENTPVTDVMTADVTCVRPSLGVEALTDLLLSKRISGAPVVDADGRPIGIVSKTDLVREHFEVGPLSADDAEWPTAVGDVMTSNALRLPETTSVGQVAALLAVEGIHRVPIVDAQGAVVGIVSPLDLVRWLAHQAGYVIPDDPRSP